MKWSEFNCTLLNTAFTNNAIASEYERAAFGMSLNSGDTGNLKLFADSVEQQFQKLESIAERLHLYPEPRAVVVDARATMPIEHRQQKVFVVHGHDDAPKAEVARFIERLGFEAIILHERPNTGRALITKFREETADVGFAVVLMTPDDLGKAEKAVDLKPRARQNVVFELGFFIGKLGPERVAALVKGDIELPSDFDGVVYISVDKEDWQAKLGGELETAEYTIDWNKVMRR